LLECLAVIGSATDRRVPAETLLVVTQRLGENSVSRHPLQAALAPAGASASRGTGPSLVHAQRLAQ